MATLPHRPLGSTGLNVSALGFGAAPSSYLKADRDRVAAVINALLDAGVNVLDTALTYPGSEEFLGEHFAGRRDDVVLVSKCGQKHKDLPGEAWTPENIAAAVDRALRLLKTDRLDVMLLHSCDLATLEADEALGALVEAREAGKILHAGYSGDNEAAAFAARLPDVAVLETSVSIADQANIKNVLPLAEKHGVGVIVKRPIANAAWKELADQKGLYKNYAKSYTERLAAMNLDPAALGFSAADWPEIAMRFTLAQPAVSTAIIGTTDPDHAAANLKVVEKGPLPPEQVERIRAAFAAAPGSDGWEGLT